MIDLTRLNGHRLLVNSDLIKFAEPAPDTTITLVTGEKLIVRESCDELIERVLGSEGGLAGSLQRSVGQGRFRCVPFRRGEARRGIAVAPCVQSTRFFQHCFVDRLL
jgi:flagellar protein FlbD